MDFLGETLNNALGEGFNLTEEINKAWEELDLPTWDKLAEHGSGSWENLQEFIGAVDWNEPWLLGLAIFYATLLITIFWTRKMFNVQTALWILICTASLYTKQFFSLFKIITIIKIIKY
jgi:hypothetical protein